MIETFLHRVGARREHPYERVAGLVVGGALAVGGGEQDAAWGAEHQLLQRVGEVAHLDLVVFAPRSQQRRLVGEVREVGADHAGGARGERAEVHARGERDRARVDFEDFAPAGAVGGLHGDAAVEAAGAQQRRVQHVGPVRGRQHDDGLGGLEAVDLGEDLVERLLALVVGAGDRHRALARAPDRVELVDEDDRRRRLLGLGEQVAHPRGADADDRLDELRRGDREERGVRLAGDRAREQRLARAGRAREQHAVGHAPAQAPVALGVAQEVDDLRQLGLGLVDPGDVLEGDPDRFRIDPPRLRAPEVAERAHRPAGLRRRAGRSVRTGPTISSVGPKPSSSSASSEVLVLVDSALIFTPFSCSSADSWLPFQKLGTCVANSFVGVAFVSLGG